MRLLLLITILFLSFPASAQTTPQQEYAQLAQAATVKYQTMISERAEARAEPSGDAEVLRTVEANTIATVLGIDGRWLLIATPDMGRIGWIPNSVVEPTDAPLPALAGAATTASSTPVAPPRDPVERIADDVATIRTIVVVQFILSLTAIIAGVVVAAGG